MYPIADAPDGRTVNGFFCTGCNSLVLSLFTGDYKECACGNNVDGGMSYVRRGYKNAAAFARVWEIYDWAPILALAEIGAEHTLTNGVLHPVTDGLIEQERLVPVKLDAMPEDGEAVALDAQYTPVEAEVEAEKAAREERDRDRAAKLFGELGDLSLVGPGEGEVA